MGFSVKKTFEISSYKKDAVNLIANRLIKKMRGYFSTLMDFAAFQEVKASCLSYRKYKPWPTTTHGSI